MPVINIKLKDNTRRTIGSLDTETKIFRKTVKESRHLFRIYDAWGIDSDYFTDVLFPNSYKIQVHDKENDVVYEITAEKLKKHGQYYHFKNKENDHGAQIFCSRRNWDKIPKVEQEERDFYLKYCI